MTDERKVADAIETLIKHMEGEEKEVKRMVRRLIQLCQNEFGPQTPTQANALIYHGVCMLLYLGYRASEGAGKDPEIMEDLAHRAAHQMVDQAMHASKEAEKAMQGKKTPIPKVDKDAPIH